jgi:hypothetical protein
LRAASARICLTVLLRRGAGRHAGLRKGRRRGAMSRRCSSCWCVSSSDAEDIFLFLFLFLFFFYLKISPSFYFFYSFFLSFSLGGG